MGICGELAGDPLATKLLVGLGVDSLSMNPASIPMVKNILPQIDFENALAFAQQILKIKGHTKIAETLLNDYNDTFVSNNNN